MQLDRRQMPLVGRSAETQAVSKWVEGTGGRCLVLSGEAGIGKTRLAEFAVALARKSDHQVLIGRVSELESSIPLGAFRDALFASVQPGDRDGVEALFGNDPRSSPGLDPAAGDGFALVNRVIDHLEQLSLKRPLFLVLEDLHWADALTFVALRRCVDRWSGGDLLTLCTRRAWPRVPELDRIEELPRSSALRLAPVADDAVLDLAAEVLDRPLDEPLHLRLIAAGGNPLFVEELLNFAQARASDDSRHDELGEGTLPDSFNAAIARRIEHLSPRTYEIVKLASLLGSRFAFDDLATVGGIDTASLYVLLEEAFGSSVLGSEGDRLFFRHDLVRDAIYEQIPTAVRPSLHRDAGRALAAAGASSSTVANQMHLGASIGDIEAISWIRRAASEVAIRSPATSARLLQNAIDLSSDVGGLKEELTAELITALLWSGEFYRAEQRAEKLLVRSDDRALAASVRFALARVAVYTGRLGDSLRYVDDALADPELPDVTRARLLADRAVRLLPMSEVEEAERTYEQAIAGAQRSGDSLALAVALCAGSRLADFRGDVGAAVELARRAREAGSGSDAAGDAIQLLQPQLYLGLALIAAEELTEAEEEVGRGLREAERVGATWIAPLFHAACAWMRLREGRLNDVIVEAEAAMHVAQETRVTVWDRWARSLFAIASVHMNELSRAREVLNELDDFGPGFWWEWTAWARGLLLEAEGEPSGALEILAEAHALEGPRAGDARHLLWDLVRLGAALDPPRAARGLDHLEKVAEASHGRGDEAMALAARGLFEDDASKLEAAAERFGATPQRLRRAQVLEEAGRRAPAKNAPRLLLAAADVYVDLGAHRDAARVEALLRERGVRRGSRSARARPKAGWDSITQTEMTVLDFVAQGLSNRQVAERLFISHRTVETHVSHLLAKLNLSSRVELVASYLQRKP